MGLGLGLIGEQLWMRGKAELAGLLINRAFASHVADGQPHRPWRWADHHPIARITVPRLGVSRMVLTGASGASLAFALGHVDGTALPGQAGNCVIAGHRDGAAAFLGKLCEGDEIEVETADGEREYRVIEMRVVAASATEALGPTHRSKLQLITCYPLDGVIPGFRRFVVVCDVAEPDPSGPKTGNNPIK